MKTYAFESANVGTVEVSVVGEYRDGFCKDIYVIFKNDDHSWEEIDDADEIMQWLVDSGVEFESNRSMAFNRDYIQSVLIDGDATEDELLAMAASWTDRDIEAKLEMIERR